MGFEESMAPAVASAMTPLLGYLAQIGLNNAESISKAALGLVFASIACLKGVNYCERKSSEVNDNLDNYLEGAYQNVFSTQGTASSYKINKKPNFLFADQEINQTEKLYKNSEKHSEKLFKDSNGSFGGDPDDDGNGPIVDSEKSGDFFAEQELVTKPAKIKLNVNWKALFALMNCFGFFGFFITSKPFTPIISAIVFLLILLSKKIIYLEKAVVILKPVAKTVVLFDSIRFIIFKGVWIASTIFIDGQMISYWTIMEIFTYVLAIAKFSEESFFSKSKRFFSQYVVFSFISIFYTYNSPEFNKTTITRCLAFVSFLFALIQVHLATTSAGKNWLKSIFKLVLPFSSKKCEGDQRNEYDNEY